MITDFSIDELKNVSFCVKCLYRPNDEKFSHRLLGEIKREESQNSNSECCVIHTKYGKFNFPWVIVTEVYNSNRVAILVEEDKIKE